MKTRQILKRYDTFYQTIRKDAVNEVITEARKIMSKHPHLVEFLMAMGTYYFIDKNNEIVSTTQEKYVNYNYIQVDSRSYFKTLNKFFLELDETLKLSGEGIRFKQTGKIVTDW